MLRTRVVWTGVAGTPYYSNFFFVGDGATSAEDAQDATIEWASQVKGIVTPSLSLQVESEVTEINAVTGEIVSAYDVAGSTSVGTATGEPLPFRTQVLTYFGTTAYRSGRRVRGRSFAGGICEPNNVDGVGPSEIVREAIQDVYVDTLGSMAASHGVWSRPRAATDTKPALPGEINSVTSYQTRPTWSSLRTRGA
uniref:Uncharacterized protein n=1 Tax=uncultured prokaryote TaxID=198431 RepID=A0A0H5Q4J7_9ZZZZ|nr:hypothetical protein [uncultured prokaryote]